MAKAVSVAVAATASKMYHISLKWHLRYEERVKIQVLRDEGYSLTAIADKVKGAVAVFLKLFFE